MYVEIQMTETSQPIVYEEARNTYTKGNMYCIYYIRDGARFVDKYPLVNIFRVCEDYKDRGK